MYAYLSAGWVLPSLIAPAIAGTITDQLGWRWVFWLLLPLIPVVAFITVRPMRAYAATGTGEVRVARIRAAVLAAAGIGLFVTALQFKNPFAAVGGVGRRGWCSRCRACAACCPPGSIGPRAVCPRSCCAESSPRPRSSAPTASSRSPPIASTVPRRRCRDS